MVSLSRSNTIGSGAIFFDGNSTMEDLETLQPRRAWNNSTRERDFKNANTVPIVSIPLVCGIALEITGIVFVCLWPEEQNKCDTYFIFLYLHCLYWLIVIICDGLYLRGIHESLRVLGYFEYYNSTEMLVKSPTFITSLWNTAFLLIAVILHHTHKWDYESYCRKSEWLTPINYILLLTTAELTILIPVYVNYIKRVRSFIKSKPEPDVVREEWVSPCLQESYDEVGLDDSESNLFELLERQANLIRYLKDHNIALSQQIIHLASQRQPDQQ